MLLASFAASISPSPLPHPKRYVKTMSKIEEKDAWKALDISDYAAAAQIWEQLIDSCSSEAEADSYKHGYGYALVGMKRWDESRAIYQGI